MDFSAILASASFYSLYPSGYHYTSILFSYNLLLITYIMYFNHIQLYSTPSLLLPSKMSILCMYIKEAYIQEVYKYNPLKGYEYMRETKIDDSHIYTPTGLPFWRMLNNLLFYIARVRKKNDEHSTLVRKQVYFYHVICY